MISSNDFRGIHCVIHKIRWYLAVLCRAVLGSSFMLLHVVTIVVPLHLLRRGFRSTRFGGGKHGEQEIKKMVFIACSNNVGGRFGYFFHFFLFRGGERELCVLSATLILSKNSRVLDTKSRLKSANLGYDRLKNRQESWPTFDSNSTTNRLSLC